MLPNPKKQTNAFDRTRARRTISKCPLDAVYIILNVATFDVFVTKMKRMEEISALSFSLFSL